MHHFGTQLTLSADERSYISHALSTYSKVFENRK